MNPEASCNEITNVSNSAEIANENRGLDSDNIYYYRARMLKNLMIFETYDVVSITPEHTRYIHYE